MKSISFAILLSTVLGILVYTNPKNSEFEGFIRVLLADGSTQYGPIERVVTGLFGGIAAHVIEENARRRDYVFFSTYQLQFGTDDVRIIGIFNNFFVVKKAYGDLLFPESTSPNVATKTRRPNISGPSTIQGKSVIFHPSSEKQWPRVEIAALESKLPFQVVRELDSRRFKILLGNNFQNYADHLEVASPIERHGSFFVGAGCVAHSCNDKLGALFLDSDTGHPYAVEIDGDVVNIFGVEGKTDIPAIIRDWIIDPHESNTRRHAIANGQDIGDYRISEGLSLASAGKTAISEYFFSHGRLPSNNLDAGMAPPSDISDKAVRSVTVRNGSLIVQFIGDDIEFKTLEIRPSEENGTLRWSCKEGGTLQEALRPVSCRH